MGAQLLKAFLLVFVSLTGTLACSTGTAREAGYPVSYERTTGEVVDDGVILTEVKALLMRDPQVSGLDINVNVFNRVVTLKGFVNSEREIERAVQLARSVDHVTKVNSKLVVDDGDSTLG